MLRLKLLGMRRKDSCRARSSATAPFLLAMSLALLALISVPALALADSSGVQYENSLPTPTGRSTPSHVPGSTHALTGAPSSRSLSLGAKTGARSSRNRSPGQRRARRRRTARRSRASHQAVPGGGGSSPLPAILILIGCLAAISIAAVVLRKQRERRRLGQAPTGLRRTG